MNIEALKTCYTCLHAASDLTNIQEEDADNVTYHTKLLKLLKVELVSQDSMGICTNCIAELREVYKFLETVKYSQQFWKKQTEVTIHIEEILPEKNDVKSVDAADKSDGELENIEPSSEDVVTVDADDKSESNDVVFIDADNEPENIEPSSENIVTVDADDKSDGEPNDFVFVDADDRSDCEPENIEPSSVGNADVNDADTHNDSGSVCEVTTSDDYIECANCTKVYPGRKFLSHDCYKAGTQVRIKRIINNNDNKSKTIEKDTFYECHVCKKLYNRKSRLIQHIASMHGKGEVSNSSDIVSVVGDIIFKMNHNETNKDNGFTCSKCSKTWEEFSDDFLLHPCFSSGHHMRPKRERRKINYNENTSSRSNDEVGTCRKSRKIDLKCKICEKECKNSLGLKEHLTLHTGEKNFCCDVCGERFRLYSSLHRHKKKHSAPPGQRTRKTPFLCTVCGRNFPYSNSYQRHMRVHMGIRNHQCQVCYRKFGVSTHLKVHMRTHTGEKPYACDICGQNFSLKPSRDKHMVKLHGCQASNYDYTCNACGESFRKDVDLQSHIKMSHYADSDEERKEAVGQIIGSYMTFHKENLKYSY